MSGQKADKDRLNINGKIANQAEKTAVQAESEPMNMPTDGYESKSVIEQATDTAEKYANQNPCEPASRSANEPQDNRSGASSDAKTEGFSRSNLRLKRAAAIVSVAIFLAVTAAVTYFCIDFFKKFSDPTEFKNYINSFGAYGRAAFLALQIIQIVIAFIPGEVVQVGAGYAYGAFEGTVLCLVGAAIASAIVFLLVKKVGTRIVYLFVSREKMDSLKFLNDEQKLGRLIFILFLIPGAPKDVLTYLAGLTRIKLYEFLIISLAARTPALLLSTLGGSAVADRNYKQAIIIFSAAAIISAAGIKFYSVLTKKLKARHENKKDKNEG